MAGVRAGTKHKCLYGQPREERKKERAKTEAKDGSVPHERKNSVEPNYIHTIQTLPRSISLTLSAV